MQGRGGFRFYVAYSNCIQATLSVYELFKGKKKIYEANEFGPTGCPVRRNSILSNTERWDVTMEGIPGEVLSRRRYAKGNFQAHQGVSYVQVILLINKTCSYVKS